MKLFLNIVLVLALPLNVACTQTQPETSAVSGELALYLHQKNLIGMYVLFELKQKKNGVLREAVIASSFKKISKNPIVFSLSYPSAKINQKNRYQFFATIFQDISRHEKITSMSAAVLTHGYPSVLHMAIQPVREPIK